MKTEYIPRLIDQTIREKLSFYGAVCLDGCKWCGKSTTAKTIAKSCLELQNPETLKDNLTIAEVKPSLLLEGEKPRLIDEWQVAPALWDAIRYDIDQTSLPNQYLLTGSATPSKNKPMHSGTGRIIRLTMRPMSLAESGDSTCEVSLRELFGTPRDIEGISKLDIEDYAFVATRGGWPLAIIRKENRPNTIAQDYLNSVVNNEVDSSSVPNHSPNKMKAVLRSLARNICSPVKNTTLQADTVGEDISDTALSAYMATLEQIHILDDIEAWSPALRSKTEIRTGKKRNFVDPSLAVAALFGSDKDLLHDFHTFGFVFESLCLRDLKIYAQNLDGDVFYYRDKNLNEVDAVIHLNDGSWGAIEIKLGSEESINEAANNLLNFASNVDISKMPNPSFLAVVTGTKYAYRRPDGVYVVPAGCLKP